MRLSRLIGPTMRLLLLLWLLAMLTGCASTRVEEAQIQANAQITAAQTEAQARIGVAQAQADATKYASAQAADAAKYTAHESTIQTGMWLGVLPVILVIIAVACATCLVLWYRGKAHLMRVTGEVALLLPPSVAQSLLSPSQPQLSLPAWIPDPVRVEAVKWGADQAKRGEAGEWLLYRHGHLLATMRPKQLTDKQGGNAWN